MSASWFGKIMANDPFAATGWGSENESLVKESHD